MHINTLKKDSAIKETELQQLKQSISELQNNPKFRNELQKMSETISRLRSQLSHSEGERLRLGTKLKKQQQTHTRDPSLARHSTPISRSRTDNIHKANIDATYNTTGTCSTCSTSIITIGSTDDSRTDGNGTNDSLPPLVLRGGHTNIRNSLSADGILPQ